MTASMARGSFMPVQTRSTRRPYSSAAHMKGKPFHTRIQYNSNNQISFNNSGTTAANTNSTTTLGNKLPKHEGSEILAKTPLTAKQRPLTSAMDRSFGPRKTAKGS